MLLFLLKNPYSGQIGDFGPGNNGRRLHHEKGQLITLIYLILSITTKIIFRFCSNTSKPPVMFMYGRYVCLILF